jgi:Mor family transcriptional regulator
MLITQRFNDGKNALEIEKYFQLNKSVVSLVIKTYRVKSKATKKNKQNCIDEIFGKFGGTWGVCN